MAPVAERNLELPRVLALAAGPEQGTDVSAPFEVIRAGKFVRGGREIELTTDDLDAMVANFERWRSIGAEAPVDYDHSFVEGGESRAAGWFTELVRKGQSLFARVRWTAKAAELIKGQEYRFFSPEWTKNFAAETGEAEGPTMIAGALTNRPFLRGMTPVALSAEVGAQAFASIAGTDVEVLAEALKPHLGGEADRRDETRGGVAKATETSITFSDDEAAKLRESLGLEEGAELSAEAIAEATKAKVAADVEAASRKRDEDGETVTMSRSELDELRSKAGEADELKGRVETMASQVGKVEKDLAEQRFSADFGQALREGRVDAKPETRESWAKRYEKYGRDDARELLFERPAETIPVSERGRGAQGDEAADAGPGTDVEAAELDRQVKAYQAEHDNTSYSQAYDAVIAAKRDREAV